MSSTIERIREEVRQLTPEERAELMDTLHVDENFDEAEWNRKWATECRRRADAVLRGDARLIPLEEVKARLVR